MNKKELIQYITDLLCVIQYAYFKGRMVGHQLEVHERSDNSAAISISLCNFNGDWQPVCEGLNPCVVRHDDGTASAGELFSMCFDPDDATPLTFLLGDSYDADIPEVSVEADGLSEDLLKNIAEWLERKMQPLEDDKPNKVTSFFYYMWNAWSEKECKKAFADGDYNHFWKKWCNICDTHGTWGAAERFYAELSNGNRDKLVRRAFIVYREGHCTTERR